MLAGLPSFWKLPSFRFTSHTRTLLAFRPGRVGTAWEHCLCSKRGASNLRGVIVMDMVGFACYSRLPRYPAGLPIIPPTNRGLSGSSWRFRTLATTRSLSPVRSIGSATSPDAAGSLKGMLIPDTLRSDHAPFWYQGVGAVLTDTAIARPLPPAERYTSNLDLSFFTGTAQIVLNATKLLEAAITWKPALYT